MAHERRRHARVKPPANYVISCTNADFSGRSSDHYNLADRLLDLSARGACVVTVGRLRPGVSVVLDISIPRARARYRVKAVVRWSQTVQSKEPHPREAHVVGLEFDRAIEEFKPKSPPPAPPPRRLARHDPRRRHRRFVPLAADVLCVPRGFWSALGFRSNAARKLKDMSLGGVQFECARKLEPGQRVDLRLELKSPRGVLRAEGEVKWCRRDTLSLEPRWLVGVVFKRLNPEDHDQLRTTARPYLD